MHIHVHKYSKNINTRTCNVWSKENKNVPVGLNIFSANLSKRFGTSSKMWFALSLNEFNCHM